MRFKDYVKKLPPSDGCRGLIPTWLREEQYFHAAAGAVSLANENSRVGMSVSQGAVEQWSG